MKWNWLPIVKDIVETLFYIITGSAVVVGLWGWKKELRGRSKYDAAKNVIAGAYRVRDAINTTRSPFMSGGEYADRQGPADEPKEEKDIRDSLYAYSKRYESVANAVSQWYPAVVEAEALFGEEARNKIKALLKSAGILKGAIETYHRNVLRTAQSYLIQQPPNKFQGQCTNIIFTLHPGLANSDEDRANFDDGGFQVDLDTAVDGIRKHFEKFIK